MITIGSRVILRDDSDGSEISAVLVEPKRGVRFVGRDFSKETYEYQTEDVLLEGGDGGESISVESMLGSRLINASVGEIITFTNHNGETEKFEVLSVITPGAKNETGTEEKHNPKPAIINKTAKKDNKKPSIRVTKEITGLKMREDVYYIYDYIPSYRFEHYPEEKTEISKKIWAYKDGDMAALKDFTKDLDDALWNISLNEKGRKFALLAVPPSKVDSYSPIRESIELITLHNNRGSSAMHRTKVLLNYGKLLLRKYDIPAMHETNTGPKPTDEERKASICCTKKDLSKENVTFVILDDVVTTGKSMKICEEILVEHGVREKNIVKLAISGTI